MLAAFLGITLVYRRDASHQGLDVLARTPIQICEHDPGSIPGQRELSAAAKQRRDDAINAALDTLRCRGA